MQIPTRTLVMIFVAIVALIVLARMRSAFGL
jgi:hypothetical protein